MQSLRSIFSWPLAIFLIFLYIDGLTAAVFCVQTTDKKTKATDLEALKVTECKDKAAKACYECFVSAPATAGTLEFKGGCGAVPATAPTGMKCEAPAKACTSATEKTCFPKLTDILKKSKCWKSSNTTAGELVFCNGECAYTSGFKTNKYYYFSGCKEQCIKDLAGLTTTATGKDAPKCEKCDAGKKECGKGKAPAAGGTTAAPAGGAKATTKDSKATTKASSTAKKTTKKSGSNINGSWLSSASAAAAAILMLVAS